jgi:hypothetical protein
MKKNEYKNTKWKISKRIREKVFVYEAYTKIKKIGKEKDEGRDK